MVRVFLRLVGIEGPALFVAQGLHGFDGGGAAGGQKTCCKADGCEYRESGAHDERIVGAYLKEQGCKGARACKRECDTGHSAGGDRREAFPQDQRVNTGALRAESETQADFALALND